MYPILLSLSNWHVMEILFVLSVVLVLIDYFFPVDFPAFIGYVCFSAAMFLALPFGVLLSAIAAVVIFLALLLLHSFVFSRYLTNATDKLFEEQELTENL